MSKNFIGISKVLAMVIFGSLASIFRHTASFDELNRDVFCENDQSFTSLVAQDKVDVHEVETHDNYIIKVFHVQNFPKNRPAGPQPPRKTLLLLHGVLDSTDEFALSDKSVLRTLLNRDYDVWLMNSRGNKYSCFNTRISNKDLEFWDYSFENMADGDFRAVLNYVYENTNQKVIVIAHSQGSTQTFAALSSYPELNGKVEKFMALGPVAFMTGFDSNDLYYFGATHNFLHVLNTLHIHKILEHKLNNNWMDDIVVKMFCGSTHLICDYLISKVCDKDPSKIDTKEMAVFLQHNPSRSNVKSLEHYAQMITNFTGALRKFDYGAKENMARYGTAIPPAYDLSKIDVKVYMYYGDNDLLTTLKNIELLKATLKSSKSNFYPGWGHLSFFLGKEREMFFQDLLKDIDEPLE
jgi:lysosomal acid lipase/cholesteryl ester hydrolase